MRNGIFTYPVIRLIVGIILFAGTTNMARADQDRIPVGTVNGETIWLDDVMRQAERLPAKFRQAPIENYFDQLVTDMVDAKIAADAARAAKYDTKKEVASAMKTAADRVLAESWIGEQINSDVNDAAIEKAYKTFVADTSSREEVTAAHILVATEDEAKAIIASLQEGADFAELAKSKSTGPSGPNGGDLGYFPRGAMVPAFENAAFALAAGSFTQTPVQTQFGWHIILVEEKRTAEAPTIEELAPQLRQNLISQNLGRLLDSLRANARIERRPFADIRLEAQASSAN